MYTVGFDWEDYVHCNPFLQGEHFECTMMLIQKHTSKNWFKIRCCNSPWSRLIWYSTGWKAKILMFVHALMGTVLHQIRLQFVLLGRLFNFYLGGPRMAAIRKCISNLEVLKDLESMKSAFGRWKWRMAQTVFVSGRMDPASILISTLRWRFYEILWIPKSLAANCSVHCHPKPVDTRSL